MMELKVKRASKEKRVRRVKKARKERKVKMVRKVRRDRKVKKELGDKILLTVILITLGQILLETQPLEI